jgi:hypothetical protein
VGSALPRYNHAILPYNCAPPPYDCVLPGSFLFFTNKKLVKSAIVKNTHLKILKTIACKNIENQSMQKYTDFDIPPTICESFISITCKHVSKDKWKHITNIYVKFI